MGDRLIFQLGTNNWQRGGEFAPGSGILHEAHHIAYNAMPGVRGYSMYPSKRQRFREDDVHVFAIEHDIPICESISPVSNYRWHGMSEDEVAAYRTRLTDEVAAWIDEIEASTGDRFGLFVAHHAFMNTVVMRDVNRRRVAAGKERVPLMCFVHGTELKMYNNEKRGNNPAEFPLRFLPFVQQEKIFDHADPDHGVDVIAAISSEQIEAFLGIFPEFPRDRVVLSHNGYNQDVFHRLIEPTDVYADRERVLAGFSTQPPAGGREGGQSFDPTGPLEPRGPVPAVDEATAEPVAPVDGFDAVVAFCGKFADWKRLDALLRAAAIYERHERKILTVIAGSGPHEAQVTMHDLAASLGLTRTYFVGPRPQYELAVLFNCADVGCFPSYKEPFGLVFIECMACGTPVIGADSGGPRDFVIPSVGTLVPETDDREALATSLAETIVRAVEEDWKQTKGYAAEAYATAHFSVVGQVTTLLEEVDRLIA
jgi:glycosyltransferase involved in cell wall biosynthesis